MILPTLKTFLRWPIDKRAALFGRWLKAQPRRRKLQFWDIKNCPLARFGDAITQTKDACWGGGLDFVSRDGSFSTVIVSADYIVPLPARTMALHKALNDSLTYGKAADAYAAALKLPLS